LRRGAATGAILKRYDVVDTALHDEDVDLARVAHTNLVVITQRSQVQVVLSRNR